MGADDTHGQWQASTATWQTTPEDTEGGRSGHGAGEERDDKAEDEARMASAPEPPEPLAQMISMIEVNGQDKPELTHSQQDRPNIWEAVEGVAAEALGEGPDDGKTVHQLFAEAQDKESVIRDGRSSAAVAPPPRLTLEGLAVAPTRRQKDLIGEHLWFRLRDLPNGEAAAMVNMLLDRDNNELMSMLDEEGCEAIMAAAQQMGKADGAPKLTGKTKGKGKGRGKARQRTSDHRQQGGGMYSSSSLPSFSQPCPDRMDKRV